MIDLTLLRAYLLSYLARDILGPRNGPEEKLNSNPLTEFITGILAPKVLSSEDLDLILETREGLVGAEDAGEGVYEEDFVEEHDVFEGFNPVLDPKSFPKSMGVSFVLHPQKDAPVIHVCVTWARYFYRNGCWERKPRAVQIDIPINFQRAHTLYLNPEGVVESSTDAEISLRIILRKRKENNIHVSVYLVNEILFLKDYDRYSSQERWIRATESHIFQPQIRINVSNARIIPTDPLPGHEENVTEFLHREKRIFAKGHMCSALWCIPGGSRVDPEIESDDPEVESGRPRAPPFWWTDGEIVKRRYGDEVWKRFIAPHIRTEFIPIYAVSSPDFSWDPRYGEPPELSAEKLSELWEPDEIDSALRPLVEGYRKWLEKEKHELEKLPEKWKRAGKRVIEEIEKAIIRIETGIELLKKDTDVRLSFCFANKAMDLQSTWSRKSHLKWHPYQLAFILMVIESIVREDSPYRDTCDLLWVPTGAGKTEAYLGIVAFTLAYRRRRALSRIGKSEREDTTGAGVAAISRYTLRLLTIQQFRRALTMITACEYLRVKGLKEAKPIGWRPSKCKDTSDFIWGPTRFSIGLWVGGNLTPNRLEDTPIKRNGKFIRSVLGAISILKNEESGRRGDVGEPAQVLKCPRCGSILSIPEGGLEAKKPHTLHLTVRARTSLHILEKNIKTIINDMDSDIVIKGVEISKLPSGENYVVSLTVWSEAPISATDFDHLWRDLNEKLNLLARDRVVLCCARPSRPGYFIVKMSGRGGRSFEIFCPDPKCELNNEWWVEGVPLETPKQKRLHLPNGKFREIHLPPNLCFKRVPDFARIKTQRESFSTPVSTSEQFISSRIPIPALTVDELIYSFPPSFLISTVDKFARLPFEPRCSSLFGIVDTYSIKADHCGYSRRGRHQDGKKKNLANEHPLEVWVPRFDPPEIILQDELHLIEGPLGSIVGIYEVAVDFLSGGRTKYIASTATVTGAESHVRTLFVRKLSTFPPHGITLGDRFLLRYPEFAHPLDESKPGRLYVGVCAPGKGPHTPIVRIWSALLQGVHELSALQEFSDDEIDKFWTLVGYFNAVRELAGAESLYRQDIPERVKEIGGDNPRKLSEDKVLELSSRCKSTDLPSLLKALETETYPPESVADAVFTTSMFGTGVDVGRLSLMVVDGQPKTTTAYVQATGRVGRKRAGLVVTFYRATRPRDLSHYEFFVGYHAALDKYVEPVTIAPFSPGTLEKVLGPVMVGILRNHPCPSYNWYDESSASGMESHRDSPEVRELQNIFVDRLGRIPASRRLVDVQELLDHIRAKLDRWESVAAQEKDRLKYTEYFTATHPVVLGTPAHEYRKISVVYSNAPNSLRDVEETVGFQATGYRGR